MKHSNRDRLINYATRLAVRVQGCMSANCPFAPDVEGRCGTAQVCNCVDQANGLIVAMQEKLTTLKEKTDEAN